MNTILIFKIALTLAALCFALRVLQELFFTKTPWDINADETIRIVLNATGLISIVVAALAIIWSI